LCLRTGLLKKCFQNIGKNSGKIRSKVKGRDLVEIRYKTVLSTILGVIIGITIVTVIRGLGVGDIDWRNWFISMAGGISGGLIMLLFALISKKKIKVKSKNEKNL
jgi:hypothetical protein